MDNTIWPARAHSLMREGFADYLGSLCDHYPIISIEDGMDESDWDGWAY